MFRKLIIVVLALGAVSAATLGVLSAWQPVGGDLFAGSGRWIRGECSHGRLRVLSNRSMLCAVRKMEQRYFALDYESSLLPQVTNGERDRPGRESRAALRPTTLRLIWGDEVNDTRVFLSEVCSVPVVVPVIILGLYPLLAFSRGPVRRWQRRQRGQCIGCGYNLRGNVTGVCPECGTEVRPP